jgi:hypothetical protein
VDEDNIVAQVRAHLSPAKPRSVYALDSRGLGDVQG